MRSIGRRDVRNPGAAPDTPAAPASATAQTVVSDFDTLHVLRSTGTPSVLSADLTGMRVTAYWDGGATVREYVWDYMSFADGT